MGRIRDFIAKLFTPKADGILLPIKVDEIKFQFSMSKKQAEEFNELATRLGMSKRDMLNGGLTLFKWVMRQRAEGRTIIMAKNPIVEDDEVAVDMDLFHRG